MVMDCKKMLFSRHAMERMFEREISVNAVLMTAREGRIIESYTDDSPYPSFLVLGYSGDRPLHCVVAYNREIGECVVVTTYIPDPEKWDDDFRRRK